MAQKSPLKHVCIIMDGNRRWARQHKMAVLQGHEYVVDKVMQPLVEHCIELGIPNLTFWVFSTENWRRNQEEVTGLMKLFQKAFTQSTEKLHKLGVKIETIGELSRLPKDLQQDIKNRVEETSQNQVITLTFAINYGGRDELVRAMNTMIEHGVSTVTETDFAEYLDTKNLPDPDLIIRPGGERRLSGFLPWQSVYTELYFTDVLMPDFTPAELDKALADFAGRQRRFGA